jgi:glycerophosphoryl diester phosphodiesterase
MKSTVPFEKRNVRMIAHRGLSGMEPENTSLAFTAAANRSYFGIETDIHRTADGKFIITHDDNIRRVTGVDCVVEETDFEVLRAIPLLNSDETERENLRFPSLQEYIVICRRYGKTAVLELKNQMEKNDIASIVRQIDEMDYLNGVIFISFYPDNLIYLRTFLPDQPAQFLYEKPVNDEVWALLRKYRFDLDIYCKSLTRETLDALHAEGFKVNVWTVDRPEVAEELALWGVDFITSNILE